ncbi:hypothetical protein SPONN_1542 [uncultured Candidatus Thioglobus sp.]|nr:hypothetical protein SPONN_1542 [uncultured Candidatus Thioglobus sp.]
MFPLMSPCGLSFEKLPFSPSSQRVNTLKLVNEANTDSLALQPAVLPL